MINKVFSIVKTLYVLKSSLHYDAIYRGILDLCVIGSLSTAALKLWANLEDKTTFRARAFIQSQETTFANVRTNMRRAKGGSVLKMLKRCNKDVRANFFCFQCWLILSYRMLSGAHPSHNYYHYYYYYLLQLFKNNPQRTLKWLTPSTEFRNNHECDILQNCIVISNVLTGICENVLPLLLAGTNF